MNTTPETISRWESVDRQISVANQRLLLLYVAEVEPVQKYSVKDTEQVAGDEQYAQISVPNADGSWPAELSA